MPGEEWCIGGAYRLAALGSRVGAGVYVINGCANSSLESRSRL